MGARSWTHVHPKVVWAAVITSLYGHGLLLCPRRAGQNADNARPQLPGSLLRLRGGDEKLHLFEDDEATGSKPKKPRTTMSKWDNLLVSSSDTDGRDVHPDEVRGDVYVPTFNELQHLQGPWECVGKPNYFEVENNQVHMFDEKMLFGVVYKMRSTGKFWMAGYVGTMDPDGMGVTWSRKSAQMRWRRIFKRPTLEDAKNFADEGFQLTEQDFKVWDDVAAVAKETTQYMKERNLTAAHMLAQAQLAGMTSDESSCDK
uniref:Uncharacterized protein n=1 Tax=Lotharella globosa TaxID=91324 RepID=A0A7S4DX85_9EUKA|mmetsp:Transcript_17015/g.32280  ORF Transcript_17015/g.32280 Transcript_17015/m.32280 type:complete len:258 (+) Transcript_17015:8-781(+)